MPHLKDCSAGWLCSKTFPLMVALLHRCLSTQLSHMSRLQNAEARSRAMHRQRSALAVPAVKKIPPIALAGASNHMRVDGWLTSSRYKIGIGHLAEVCRLLMLAGCGSRMGVSPG